MYPAPFDYTAPTSLEEATAALADLGAEGRVLAGGQSLLPMMKLRLAVPAHLVDINRVPGLDTIESVNGHLQIGALVRHADVVGNETVAGASPLMANTAKWVADPLVRNRGTVCGSVAHCDPEGDWNSVLLATGAEVVARGVGGERSIPIESFLQGMFTNALDDDEMVTEVRIRVPHGPWGGSYLKLERKVGDYASVAAATHLELDDRGAIGRAGIALTSVYSHNLKVTEAEEVLVGEEPGEELFAEAAETAARVCDPHSDVRGSAEWKRQVVRTYVRRGLAAAAEQAKGS